MKYFLAPRSGEKSYNNFLSTIKHGVPLDRISRFLTEEGRSILSREEVIYAWGNRAGKRGDWNKIQNGDIVIFYAHYSLIMAGRVIYKQHSPNLALAMWPPDDNGNPWEYTFFLDNLAYFKIPIQYFNLVSDYKFRSVQGFQEITQPHMVKLLERYRRVEDLFDEFKDETSVEIPKETEELFINVEPGVEPMIFKAKLKTYEKDDAAALRKKSRFGYIDFDEKNKLRAKTGSRGEEIVVTEEKRRLSSSGRNDLAEKVERISLKNTYAGYDVLSFDEAGEEKKIEVKATTAKKTKKFSFNLSKNERDVADKSSNYYIYLVFSVKSSKPEIAVIDFKNDRGAVLVSPTQFIVKGEFD